MSSNSFGLQRIVSGPDRELDSSKRRPEDHGVFESGVVFVGMSFKHGEMEDVYAVIKEECEKLSLRAQRVDEGAGSRMVLRDIITLIKSAEFIVFDLTDSRPNVYYELGFAHGVGNDGDDIFLIAKRGTKLHFDISPCRVELYSSTNNLRELIRSKLGKMVAAKRARY